jgi:hypothetical protein
MFKDVGRVTFDVPHREVLFLLFIQALKRELGQEEGAPDLLRNSLIKTAALKTLADEVKEAIKESRRHRKLTQDEVGEPYQVIKVVGPSL